MIRSTFLTSRLWRQALSGRSPRSTADLLLYSYRRPGGNEHQAGVESVRKYGVKERCKREGKFAERLNIGAIAN
jgi:hypothetical protein